MLICVPLFAENSKKDNSTTCARFFNGSLRNVCPHKDTVCKKVIEFISDAAPYIDKASILLRVLFPNFDALACSLSRCRTN